jgi:hypothetical protein
MVRSGVGRIRSWLSIGTVIVLAGAMLGITPLAEAAKQQDACSSGSHSLQPFGSRVYPEMGNGGYRSIHSDVYLQYDSITNQFLPGTHVDLQVKSTQCLTDLSFDFERTNGSTAGGTGPDLTLGAVTVNGVPATTSFVQPTYPGDPNGDNDPDPLAHQVSNVNPVSATNPNPPACSPQVSNSTQNGTACPANKLVVTPSTPIPNDSTVTVTINYTGRPGVHVDGDGSTEGWFRIATAGAEGAFVTTEPVGTDSWMPLNNHPSAKPTYDFYDTTNIGKQAIASGELVGYSPPVGAAYSAVPAPASNPPDANWPTGSVTWHWHSPEPIANYLVENTVGAYDVSARTSPTTGIQYFQAVGSNLTATRKTAIKTALDQQEDITEFQKGFNGPWPFTTDGILVATPSVGFAEEMQTKITFGNGTTSTPSLGTINHENMHQWFGDNVAEDIFEHTFWKEGWATVGEYLATARTAANAAGGLGTPTGQTAFDNSLIGRFNTNYGTTSNTFWNVAPSNPTVNNLFTTAHTYTRPGTTYLALRQILDASATRPASDRWIQVMKYIQSTYGGGNITERQLKMAFQQYLPNQSAGCIAKLDTFFTQWLDTPYPGLNTPTNKPQISGPGLNGPTGGTPDRFYDNATACTKATQTITFGALGNKVRTDPDFTVSATSDSGLPVSFGASGPCTVTGNSVHLTGPGDCTITASQAGDGVYNAAADVPQTFKIADTTHLNVAPATGPYAGTASVSATLTADATGNPVPNESISFTLNGNSVGSALTDGSGVANIAAASLAGINAGSYPTGVSGSFAGDDSLFTGSSGTGALTVTTADQTINFAALPDRNFGTPDFQVSATATSGLPVTFSTAGQCTNTGDMVHLTAAGHCDVTAHQAGDSNWNAAPDVTQGFTVKKGNQTINFPPQPHRTWLDPDSAVTGVTATSGLPITFAKVLGKCSVSPAGVVHFNQAGTCTVSAHQGGNANWDPAPTVQQDVVMDKKSQTINFPQPPDKTFGDPDFLLAATSTSGLVVKFNRVSGPCKVTRAGSVHLVGPGLCTVRAHQDGNKNFLAAPDVIRSFDIN